MKTALKIAAACVAIGLAAAFVAGFFSEGFPCLCCKKTDADEEIGE